MITRTIRSFVCRNGRITPAQKKALQILWPRYGVEVSEVLNLEVLFGRSAPTHLEIGFGQGDALIAMAQTHPEYDFLGIEVHRPGIGHLLMQLETAQLTNIRVLCADAVDILQQYLLPHSLAAVYLFFPDPWPKKRHHKRRLVQPHFVNLLAQRIAFGGLLHLATDWQDYAEHMWQILETTPEFVNAIGDRFAPRPINRPLTRFEQRGHRLGYSVKDLFYIRQDLSIMS